MLIWAVQGKPARLGISTSGRPTGWDTEVIRLPRFSSTKLIILLCIHQWTSHLCLHGWDRLTTDWHLFQNCFHSMDQDLTYLGIWHNTSATFIPVCTPIRIWVWLILINVDNLAYDLTKEMEETNPAIDCMKGCSQGASMSGTWLDNASSEGKL